MERVLDYLGENHLVVDTTQDYERLLERSREGDAFICMDACDVSAIDDVPPFEAKYTVGYEEKTEHGLYRLLSD